MGDDLLWAAKNGDLDAVKVFIEKVGDWLFLACHVAVSSLCTYVSRRYCVLTVCPGSDSRAPLCEVSVVQVCLSSAVCQVDYVVYGSP